MREISIIIVNYKSPELLRLCLASVRENIQFKHEVIVVDSATSRETEDIILEEFPDYTIIPFKENTGYSKGVNAGIKKSKYKYIFILNPDVVIIRGAIESLMDKMESDKKIGLIGPKLLNFDGTVQQSCFAFYTPSTILARRTFLNKTSWGQKILNRFMLKDKNLEQAIEVDWLMGSALLTRKDCVDEVGYMNESFFMYFEDVEWAKRFWQKELKVLYYPQASLYHYHKRESKSRLGMLDAIFNQKTRWHIQSALRFFLLKNQTNELSRSKLH